MPFAHLAFLTLFLTACLIAYFDLRSRALAPSVAEARIQALQARIRPHFLYNSINAVLSLIRSDPRRAEGALEDLADLFRVLMADTRTLAPIANEIQLARQYLELESLRLGDRLKVTWRIEGMPKDALVLGGATRVIVADKITDPVTKKELRLMVPYTPQHILRLEKQDKFPRRIRIGERRVGWRLSDIEAWLAQRERLSSLVGDRT